MRLLGALTPLILLKAVPAPLQMATVVAFLAAVTVMMTNHRFNFAGHVCMAADEEEGLRAVQERITQVIEATRHTSKKVVVVAHSQGGYLAHRALVDMQLSNITLITVGSGLRPITVLRVMGSRPAYVFACWAALAGTLSIEAWLLTHFDPGDVISPFQQAGVAPGLLFAGLVVGVMPPDLRESATPMSLGDSITSSLARLTIDWWLLAALGAYAIVFFVVRRWGNEFVEALHIRALRQTDWTDVTTHHDMVGRLTVPTLPSAVEEKAVVVTGNAILDHTRYLNKPGVTSWLVAEQIAKRLGQPMDSRIEESRLNALARSSRRHDLRAAAVAAPLLFIGLAAVVGDEDPMNAMIAFIPNLAGVFLALSAFVWIADTKDSRELAVRLRSHSAARPAPADTRPRIAEAGVLIVVAVVAMMSGQSVALWIHELNLVDSTVLVSVCLMWTLAGLFLAAVVAAGYRPPAAKVTGSLAGISLTVALPAWHSASPFYPSHFAPLGLPVILVLATWTLACLIGFKRLQSLPGRAAQRLSRMS